MEVTTDRDTQPAPPLHDEVTKPDNRPPALPSPKELLESVGEFSREIRDSFQELRTTVENNNKTFLEKIDALERRFNDRFQILSNQMTELTQENVKVHERLDDLENRVERLELDKRRPSEAP